MLPLVHLQLVSFLLCFSAIHAPQHVEHCFLDGAVCEVDGKLFVVYLITVWQLLAAAPTTVPD